MVDVLPRNSESHIFFSYGWHSVTLLGLSDALFIEVIESSHRPYVILPQSTRKVQINESVRSPGH